MIFFRHLERNTKNFHKKEKHSTINLDAQQIVAINYKSVNFPYKSLREN